VRDTPSAIWSYAPVNNAIRAFLIFILLVRRGIPETAFADTVYRFAVCRDGLPLAEPVAR
jgi:hypothetical protein